MKEEFMLTLSDKKQTELILKTNDYTCKFGLRLTEQDTMLLLAKRRESLLEEQRVEFGQGVIDRLIFAFCDSDYIDQNNYVETINRLQGIFYLYKNESLDELTDDELIEVMRSAFDDECHGSLDYLEDTFLDEFARNIRSGSHSFLGSACGDARKYCKKIGREK